MMKKITIPEGDFYNRWLDEPAQDAQTLPTANEVYVCPCCKWELTEDCSPTTNNGIIGQGYASWKLLDVRVCRNCGNLFMPLPCTKRGPL